MSIVNVMGYTKAKIDALLAALYAKPAGGIPSTDLTSAVQASLGKADSALQSAPVASVAGKTGAVSLVKADVGLGSVDNTADASKPVSTAQQTALDLKAPLASPTFTGTVGGVSKSMVGLGSVDNTADASKPVSTAQQTALNLKAPLAAPALTGAATLDGSPVLSQTVGDGSYVTKVPASGDVTGATDSAAILAAVATGACHLTGGKIYWVNRQIVVPDTVDWRANEATIRQAAGTNLQVPMVVNQNFAAPGGVAGAAPLLTSMPGSIDGLIIDVNCTAQDYSGQAWLTAGPNYLNGPDAITICGRDFKVNVEILNPVRHGLVTTDASAGTNVKGIYSGVGDMAGGTGAAKNVYGNKVEYTVTGYALYGGRTTMTGCTTTAGTNTATVPGAAGTVKPGMVAYGAGVAPNTIVTAVAGTAVTFSQNLVTNVGATLYFTWGQRGRWNTAVGGGCTDGWETRGQVRSMNGDWMVKFDVSGGWRFGFQQHWASAYGVAQHLFADHGVIEAATFANLGAGPANIPVQIGALAADLTNNASLTSVGLAAAVGVALPQYTPIIIPTTGKPMVTVLSAACLATDTALSVYRITNTSGATVTAGAAVRIPLVGVQANGFSGSAERQVYTNESPGNDYVYHQEVSYSVSSNGATGYLSKLGTLRAQNGARLDATNANTGKTVTVTNGSSTVADTGIQATDSGFPVAGTGIPAASYVSAVVPGVSFVISSSPSSSVPVVATSDGTAVTIGISGATSVGLSLVMQGSANTWTVRDAKVINQGQTAVLTTYTTSGAGTYSFPDGLPGGSPTVTAPTPVAVFPAAPAGINSTSAQMLGLAAGANPAVYTPSLTGIVKVRISGLGYTATAKVNFNVTGRWGTGTPPANGAATTGTAFAHGTLTYGTAGATNHGEQVMTVAVLAGLAVGTPIWVDLAAWTSTLGDAATFEGMVVEFDELV